VRVGRRQVIARIQLTLGPGSFLYSASLLEMLFTRLCLSWHWIQLLISEDHTGY